MLVIEYDGKMCSKLFEDINCACRRLNRMGKDVPKKISEDIRHTKKKSLE